MLYSQLSRRAKGVLRQTKDLHSNDPDTNIRIARECLEAGCRRDDVARFLVYGDTGPWKTRAAARAAYRKVEDQEPPLYIGNCLNELQRRATLVKAEKKKK